MNSLAPSRYILFSILIIITITFLTGCDQSSRNNSSIDHSSNRNSGATVSSFDQIKAEVPTSLSNYSNTETTSGLTYDEDGNVISANDSKKIVEKTSISIENDNSPASSSISNQNNASDDFSSNIGSLSQITPVEELINQEFFNKTFQNNTKNFDKAIVEVYRRVLGRDPDKAGYEYWYSWLRKKGDELTYDTWKELVLRFNSTREEILSFFDEITPKSMLIGLPCSPSDYVLKTQPPEISQDQLLSEEFFIKNLKSKSPEYIVELAYRVILKRRPDEGGLEFYKKQLLDQNNQPSYEKWTTVVKQMFGSLERKIMEELSKIGVNDIGWRILFFRWVQDGKIPAPPSKLFFSKIRDLGESAMKNEKVLTFGKSVGATSRSRLIMERVVFSR